MNQLIKISFSRQLTYRIKSWVKLLGFQDKTIWIFSSIKFVRGFGINFIVTVQWNNFKYTKRMLGCEKCWISFLSDAIIRLLAIRNSKYVESIYCGISWTKIPQDGQSYLFLIVTLKYQRKINFTRHRFWTAYNHFYTIPVKSKSNYFTEKIRCLIQTKNCSQNNVVVHSYLNNRLNLRLNKLCYLNPLLMWINNLRIFQNELLYTIRISFLHN